MAPIPAQRGAPNVSDRYLTGRHQNRYEVTGSGPAVIVVTGATAFRAFDPSLASLASLLAPNHTIITYDRRGRGESGDTQPHATRREIEDIAALIDAAGGHASLV